MSKRLLVVDDEPNLLFAVSACLRAEGYEVATARSGREALLRVAEGLPDLVISDIRMPGMDGYALARQLRSSPRTDLIPIVFLTAKDEMADRIEGFRSGVDAYLTKPFEPDELLAVVANILERIQRTHAEIARLIGTQQQTQQTTVVRRDTHGRRGANRRCRGARARKQGDRIRVRNKCPNRRESYQPYSVEDELRQPSRYRAICVRAR